jgi:hypothetical protein
MRNEADQFFEDLEYIRSNAGSVGPDHPKVKKWVAEVREYLKREGNPRDLKKFEQLEFVRRGAEMWSQNNVSPGNIRKYQTQLDQVETILAKMVEPSSQSSADQKLRELFLTPEEESTDEDPLEEAEVETQVETLVEKNLIESRNEEEALEETEVETQVEALVEKTLVEEKGERQIAISEGFLNLENVMNQKIEPNFETVTKQHLSPPARERAVDQLIAELSTEMKSLDPDWDKIQRVMGSLMGLKKTGELLERLKAETNNPGVKWEAVRKIMGQLWSIKKEMVIDLLPTLLET